jgi:putative ABC transport system permease protein
VIVFLNHVSGAFGSIWRAKLRSFLTILGIVIGISSVIAVIAIGNGLHAEIKKQVDVLGVKVLTLSAHPNSIDFNQLDINNIRKVSTVVSVAPIMYVNATTTYQQNSYSSLVTATTPDIKNVISQPLETGRYIKNGEQNVALIGSTVAGSLFGKGSPLNKNITLTYISYSGPTNNEKVNTGLYKVIGVYKKLSGNSSVGLGGELDGGVFIPISNGTAINGNRLQISTILVKVNDSTNIHSATQSISQTLTAHRDKQQGFSITNAEDIAKSYNTTLSQITSFIAAVAAISLLVGGIGIMNIMLSSVSERTREIGVRKAIGANQKTILIQFLVESLILTTIGGILGIFGSFGLAYLAGIEIKISPQFTLPAYLIGVSISLFIGLLFGVIPATHAARKKPIDALRHD